MKLESTPSITPQVSMKGNNSVEAGPYVFLGLLGRPGAVYIDRQHFEQILTLFRNEGGGLVLQAQHEEVVKRLQKVLAHEVTFDRDRREWFSENEQLKRQVATLTDDLASAHAGIEIRDRRIAELQVDPSTVARQSLIDSLRAPAVPAPKRKAKVT